MNRALLAQSVAELVEARTPETRAAAANRAVGAVERFVAEAQPMQAPEVAAVAARTAELIADLGAPVSDMTDGELADLNRLLPWAAMTADPAGRIVGNAWSHTKRAAVHHLIDRRQAAFNDTFSLKGKHVLEIGCFEGIHTLGLHLLGARVTGVDSRVENILKTMARLWAYGVRHETVLWNVEHAVPTTLPAEWDVLHHVGVLYHVTNPVEHLLEVLPRTRSAVLLDTHVSNNLEAAVESYEVAGKTYNYFRQPEPVAGHSPFAGMEDHAKYLVVEEMMDLLVEQGFTDTRLVENRAERNGRRVMIWAFRG